MLFFSAYFQGATGIIVGAVVGSVAAVAVAVGIFVFFRMEVKKASQQEIEW